MVKSLRFFPTLYGHFNNDKVLRLASAIAFSSILSIAPLFIVLISMFGWVLGLEDGGHGHHIAQVALLKMLSKMIGSGPAASVGQLVDTAFNKPRENLWAQIIGWIGFISGAAGLFSALQDSLNAIWHIEGSHGDWKHVVRTRVSSFFMILVVAAMLVGTAMMNTAISWLALHAGIVGTLLNNPALHWVCNELITVALLTVAFAGVYKVLPDVQILWRDIWLGSVITAILLIVGEALIALYLAHIGGTSIYGVAGSLLVALLWIYYSAVIILLGAECTKVMATHAQTLVPCSISILSEQAAGVDPRQVS